MSCWTVLLDLSQEEQPDVSKVTCVFVCVISHSGGDEDISFFFSWRQGCSRRTLTWGFVDGFVCWSLLRRRVMVLSVFTFDWKLEILFFFFFGRKKDIVLSSCPRTLVIHFPLEGLLDFRARLVFYFTHACLHELWRVRERLESWRRWCWRRRSCSFGVSFFPPFYSGEQIKGEDLLHLFHLFFSYPLSRIYNRRNARDFSVCEHHVHFEAKNRQTIRDYDPEKNARVEAEKTIQGLHFSDFFFFVT